MIMLLFFILGIKNLEKKVQFNKAVAEADDLFMLRKSMYHHNNDYM